MNSSSNPTDIVQSRVFARRSQIVGSIRSPLGFFALSLLIVEAFLLGAGIFFQLSPALRVVMIAIGIALFLLVFLMVCWLVVKHPTNLVFSEQSHVEYAALNMYGHSSTPITATDLELKPAVVAPEETLKKQLESTKEEAQSCLLA